MSERQESMTAASAVFEALRRDLINGRFGAGEKLTISALKAHYQVGLSPLREALNQLAAYGLLLQEHQRGFRVPEISREALDDIADMRRELECMALERAMRQGDAEWESELLAAAHRLKRAEINMMPLDEWEVLHARFHRTLVAPCGSRWLLRFLDQLHDQFDRYRRLAPSSAEIRQKRDEQHYRLAELAIERNHHTAIALLQEHIQLSYEVALGSCR